MEIPQTLSQKILSPSYSILSYPIPYNQRSLWINEYTPSYDQVIEFVKSHKEYDWKRKAIAAFLTAYSHGDYLKEAVSWLDDDAPGVINDIRAKAMDRENNIVSELNEMGYDENGKKL